MARPGLPLATAALHFIARIFTPTATSEIAAIVIVRAGNADRRIDTGVVGTRDRRTVTNLAQGFAVLPTGKTTLNADPRAARSAGINAHLLRRTRAINGACARAVADIRDAFIGF